MAVFRVGPLPNGALEAAAMFHGEVLPKILALLNPPRDGEGDHAKHGGGGSPQAPHQEAGPLHHPAGGPPPLAGEDLVLIFPSAPFDHRGWRLAAVQGLARAAASVRVNGVAGDNEDAIAQVADWLAQAPGITGQLLAVEAG